MLKVYMGIWIVVSYRLCERWEEGQLVQVNVSRIS